MNLFERHERPNIIPVGNKLIELPHQFTALRPHQEQAILEIEQKFESGARVVFLDAPTGAGKTIIGEAVRQLRAGAVNRGIYLCTTLTLQDQFMADFPEAKLIKGRTNYATLDEPMRLLESGLRHLDASDCEMKTIPSNYLPFCNGCDSGQVSVVVNDRKTRIADMTEFENLKSPVDVQHCDHCHPVELCPYRSAKAKALEGPLSVANTAYFLSEANFVGEFGYRESSIWGPQRHFPIAVIDEADTLESVMMGFVDLHISNRMMKRTGLDYPQFVTKPESWVKWCDYAVQHLQKSLKSMRADQRTNSSAKLKDEIESFGAYVEQAKRVKERIKADPDNWVFDGKKAGELKLRAITVGPYGEDVLWKHADQFLLMSATLVSADQLAEDLGIPRGQYATVTVDSQFPVDRRPINVMPKVSMTAKTKETGYPAMAEAIGDIVALHPVDRILIHTVSYDLTRYLQGELVKRFDRPIFYYLSSKERAQALEQFRNTHAGVMLAPSFDRGVDLPDDDVRVIIIAKVPFPYLGDKQVSARFYGTGHSGRSWYATQTVRSLVQMTGRGMRHKDDYCTSYILDAQFNSNVWRNNRHFIPQWWQDAVRFGPVSR